jgi:hypothetical protein
MTRQTLFRILVATYLYLYGDAWLAWIVTPRRFKRFRYAHQVNTYHLTRRIAHEALKALDRTFQFARKLAETY